MKRAIKRFTKDLQVFLKSALTTQSEEGSGLGVFLRSLLRKRKFSPLQLIGVNLAGMAFFAGVVIPQTQDAISNFEVTRETGRTVIEVVTPGSVFQWPLHQFGISQEFSAYHPAMDLTDPLGTPIYPVANGWVEWVRQLPYGYGLHVLVRHNDGVESLYAHMSKVFVTAGQTVTKNTQLGEVGETGWATGPHVHLEVYTNGAVNNPREILPALQEQ